MAKYTLDHRGRKMEELGDEYWINNAKSMKEWRENNPEKVKEIYQKKKENINAYYKIYQDDASNKNLPFEITLEQYLKLVKNHIPNVSSPDSMLADWPLIGNH